MLDVAQVLELLSSCKKKVLENQIESQVSIYVFCMCKNKISYYEKLHTVNQFPAALGIFVNKDFFQRSEQLYSNPDYCLFFICNIMWHNLAKPTFLPKSAFICHNSTSFKVRNVNHLLKP